ncbi:MAG: type II toxin-antitoxin system HicA family toxin [Clostridiales bacterium]|nr:type II toxin-antitoxin system HicA family toxin [Clostridiales bacterium]
MRYREVVRILKKNGWYICDVSGSHVQFLHPVKKGRVTVPCHNGDIKKGILHSIETQSGISFNDYKKR